MTQNMAFSADLSVPQDDPANPSEPLLLMPPIAGFWRRLLAYVVDNLLLGVFGQLLGMIFLTFLCNIGPYARPIGWLIALAYFAVMNSKICGGQTLGKRLMKIAVRNGKNEPISVPRAILRTVILSLPALVNGWSIPIFLNSIAAWIATVLIFGLGGAILYTMIFNAMPRQGMHDLLVGTYVVHLAGKPIAEFPRTRLIHKTISVIWICLIAVGSVSYTFFFPNSLARKLSPSEIKLFELLNQDSHFLNASVSSKTTLVVNGPKKTALNIVVWHKGKVTDEEAKEITVEIAKEVFTTVKTLSMYDEMSITVKTGYELYIATWGNNYWDSLTLQEWQDEILQTKESFEMNLYAFFN